MWNLGKPSRPGAPEIKAPFVGAASRRASALLFGLALIVLLAMVRLADPYPVRALRNIAFDYELQLWRKPAPLPPVRIVDVDEASLRQFGQWPWPRDRLAALTRTLQRLGAASIAYDVLFPEPDRLSPGRAADADARPADHDRQFAAALGASPSVLGFALTAGQGLPPGQAKAGFAVVGGDPSAFLPPVGHAVNSLPELTAAATGLGGINLAPGGSVGAVRRLPLLWADGNRLYPSLSLEALRVALGADTILVMTDDEGAVANIRLGPFEVPADSSGALTLSYPRLPGSLFISASDLLGPDPDRLADQINASIVFVGTTASGLSDIKGTPLGINMPGVEIHALALTQIVNNLYIHRADWVSAAELLGFVALALVIMVVILTAGPAVSLLTGLGLAALVVAGCAAAFVLRGIQLDPGFPLVGGFITYTGMIFFQYLVTDADKRRVRAAFGQYVSPQLLARIEQTPGALRLGGEVRDLTVMFCDIRNFTSLSEGLDPDALVALLNTLFQALGTGITEQSGTIDKFIGDAIMAFWNAPVDVPDHPARAVAAALGMRKALDDLNRQDAFGLKAKGHPMQQIEIGIGLATGEALVGNLGLESRFDYSCVGDNVNVASRVESACKTVGYDILAASAVREAAPDFAWLEAGSISMKGKSEPEPTFILVGGREHARSSEFADLAAAHKQLLKAISTHAPADDLASRCLGIVLEGDPYLQGFYNRLAERADDFRPPRLT